MAAAKDLPQRELLLERILHSLGNIRGLSSDVSARVRVGGQRIFGGLVVV